VSVRALFGLKLILWLGILTFLTGGMLSPFALAQSHHASARFAAGWLPFSPLRALPAWNSLASPPPTQMPDSTDTQAPLSWSEPINISRTAGDSRLPALAVDGRGVVHIVWEDGRYIFHSYRSGESWSTPLRIATGEQPAIAIDHNDIVHVVFVNEFRGNYDIYYCRWNGAFWTLPVNVSNTSGVSAIPDIAVSSYNTLYVTWTDNSLGYNVIYYGVWTGTFWINQPVPQGRGTVSTIAIGGDDIIHIAWQDRDDLETPYEIYHTQWDRVAWTLPENISDSANHSTIAAMAVDNHGVTHLVWEELVSEKDEIYYAVGTSLRWSQQQALSSDESSSYLPTIIVDAEGTPHVAWDELRRLPYMWRLALFDWRAGPDVANNIAGVADIALDADAESQVHAAWSQRVDGGNWEIYYSSHAPLMSHRMRLPLLFRHGPP